MACRCPRAASLARSPAVGRLIAGSSATCRGLIAGSPANMPPKARSAAPSAMAKFLRNERHKLCEISVSEMSGWRELDPERVAELRAMILDGGWGATALAGPSLVADNDKVLVVAEVRDSGLA